MTRTIMYSVVVPVHNSENSLKELCTRIINTLSHFSFELIFVDDGSNDKSWQVISRLKNEYPGIINAIQLQKNYGQHAALSCAFSICKGDFTVTIDDDLQYHPEDILLLIQKQKELDSDIVYGVTNNKHHSLIRNLASNLIPVTLKDLVDNKNKASPFRLLSKKLFRLLQRSTITALCFWIQF